MPPPKRGGDDRPRARAAQLAVGEHGAEAEHARQRDEVVGGEAGHEAEHPAALPDLGDALLELRPEVRDVLGRVRRAGAARAARDEERGGDDEGGGVDGERRTGAQDDDQRARGRGADDVAGVLREADQRVGLLELVRPGRARGRARPRPGGRAPRARRRARTGRSGATARPCRRAAARRSSACTAARPRSETSIIARRETRSAQTPAGRTRNVIGSTCAASTSPSCAGGAVELVEDREGERDGQQRVADHRHRLARVEQAELAVAQDGDVAHGGAS